MIGIISYLPNNTELRATRKKNADKQLDWLAELLPKEKPIVIAQGYTQEDLRDGVEYFVYEKGIGSHCARNEILKMFYASNDVWLLMMDDDVITYDYYNSGDFIRKVYYNEIALASDMILPLQPEMSPFKMLNFENDIKHYWTLTRSAATNCPNMMLLHKNNTEIFFDTSIDLLADDAVPDDNKFVVTCIANGMRVHRADFWIKKSLDRDVSVIYSKDKEENYMQHSNLGKNLAKYVMSTYKVKSVSDFNKCYNKAVPIRIKRDVEYDIPENLMPKFKVQTSANKLF